MKNQKGSTVAVLFGSIALVAISGLLTTVFIQNFVKKDPITASVPSAKPLVNSDAKDCGSMTESMWTDISWTKAKDNDASDALTENPCFENAYMACDAATLTIEPKQSRKDMGFGKTLLYEVKSNDESGKCEFGYIYKDHPAKNYVGRGVFCKSPEPRLSFLNDLSNILYDPVAAKSSCEGELLQQRIDLANGLPVIETSE